MCFFFACLRSGYFFSNVTSVSGLSILDCPFCCFKCLIVLYLIGFSMGTLSIEGYNTEYRGFLPTNDTSKLELIFCCREDPNSTLSQTLPLTYPFILLKVPVIQKKSTTKKNKKQNKTKKKKKNKAKKKKKDKTKQNKITKRDEIQNKRNRRKNTITSKTNGI